MGRFFFVFSLFFLGSQAVFSSQEKGYKPATIYLNEKNQSFKCKSGGKFLNPLVFNSNVFPLAKGLCGKENFLEFLKALEGAITEDKKHETSKLWPNIQFLYSKPLTRWSLFWGRHLRIHRAPFMKNTPMSQGWVKRFVRKNIRKITKEDRKKEAINISCWGRKR